MTTTSADLTDAERKLRDAYLEGIEELAEPVEGLRHYAGALGCGVLGSIRADRIALQTWYERLNAFSSGLMNLNGAAELTPAAAVLAQEQADRYFSAESRFNALVVHWLIEGTPVPTSHPRWSGSTT